MCGRVFGSLYGSESVRGGFRRVEEEDSPEFDDEDLRVFLEDEREFREDLVRVGAAVEARGNEIYEGRFLFPEIFDDFFRDPRAQFRGDDVVPLDLRERTRARWATRAPLALSRVRATGRGGPHGSPVHGRGEQGVFVRGNAFGDGAISLLLVRTVGCLGAA